MSVGNKLQLQLSQAQIELNRKINSLSALWVVCGYYWSSHQKKLPTLQLSDVSMWQNPSLLVYSICAPHKSERRPPYMLLWAHDLSCSQTHPDLELQGCSNVALLCDSVQHWRHSVFSHTVSALTTTHSHACTSIFSSPPTAAKSSFSATKH